MANIKEVMLRKYGALPVWAWTALAAAGIGAVMLWQRRNTPVVPTGGAPTSAGGGPSGEFQSSQSKTTTDKDGNQITTNYAASGPLSGIPGFLTTQAGPMPYSGGDVYVNYPNSPAPQQTTNNLRQTLDVQKFNAASSGGSPWLMTVANAGETWLDITARVYGFGKDFASVTDPKAQARVKEVAPFIQNSNNAPGSTGSGPAGGSVVFFH